jgi:hypothetical protein
MGLVDAGKRGKSGDRKMIRFIDLRGAGTGYRFAFWDTVTSSFMELGGDQAWDDEADLVDSIGEEGKEAIAKRLIGLMPDWAKEPGEDEGFWEA